MVVLLLWLSVSTQGFAATRLILIQRGAQVRSLPKSRQNLKVLIFDKQWLNKCERRILESKFKCLQRLLNNQGPHRELQMSKRLRKTQFQQRHHVAARTNCNGLLIPLQGFLSTTSTKPRWGGLCLGEGKQITGTLSIPE